MDRVHSPFLPSDNIDKRFGEEQKAFSCGRAEESSGKGKGRDTESRERDRSSERDSETDQGEDSLKRSPAQYSDVSAADWLALFGAAL
jgi:hypothetical protein